MSWAEIKKAVNSKFNTMPLDKMFGLSLVSSGTVTVAGNLSNYNSPTTVLDIQNVSGFVVFSPDTGGEKVFPDMTGAIPFYGTLSPIGTTSVVINKWLLPLDASKRYTFKQSCRKSGSVGSWSYSDSSFTYALYSFGGGIS